MIVQYPGKKTPKNITPNFTSLAIKIARSSLKFYTGLYKEVEYVLPKELMQYTIAKEVSLRCHIQLGYLSYLRDNFKESSEHFRAGYAQASRLQDYYLDHLTNQMSSVTEQNFTMNLHYVEKV